MDKPRLGEPFHADVDATPDSYIDEPKFATWKVTLVVVLFCGAVWAGISAVATYLLS